VIDRPLIETLSDDQRQLIVNLATEALVRIQAYPDQGEAKRDLKEIIARLSGEDTVVRVARADPSGVPPEKDRAAVELGRRGGLRGGSIRAERMTPEERSESARAAATARWNRAPI